MKLKSGFGIGAMITLLIALSFIMASCAPTGSGTVISLGQVQLASNDPTIGGQAWLINFIDNGGSQSIYGYFSADQIKTSSGEKPLYPLQINIDSSSQKCQYIIYAQSEKIKHLEFSQIGNVFFKEDCAKNCLSNGYNGEAWAQSYIATYTCYCTKYTDTATVGTVSFDKLQFSTNIKATINGKSYIGTVSNAGAQSAWLGNNDVYVSWYGNLVSGQDCPQPSGQQISAVYQNGWKFVDFQRVQSSLNAQAVGLKNCITSKGSVTKAIMQDCVSQFNSLESNALISKQFKAVGGETAIQSGSLSNGQASITLSKQIQFPSFLMRVKAYLLGIYVSVGKPEIISTSSQCFQTGTDGFIVTKVKNTGDSTASFIVSADCPSPFQQSGTSLTVSVSPQETKTVNIPITGQASSEVKKQCTINVQDRENPNNKDSASVSTCVQPIVICNAGQTRCNGNAKEQCNSAGSGWELKDSNSNDCTTPNNSPTCEPLWKIATVTILPNLACDLGSTFIWIMAIVGALIGFYFTLDFMNKRDKKAKGLNWTLSIIIGSITGIFVYLYWWAIIIILALIIILQIVKKFVL